MNIFRTTLLAGALFLLVPKFVVAAQTGPVRKTPNPSNLYEFVQTLASSPEPAYAAMRARCALAPSDLAKERKLADKIGMLRAIPVKSSGELPNAAPILAGWDLARRARVKLPTYAESMDASFEYSPAQIAAVRKILDKNATVYNSLHRGSDLRNRTYPRSEWRYLNVVRDAARQLGTESFILAKDGNFDDALLDSGRQLNLVKQYTGHNNIIEYLASISIEQTALHSLRNTLYLGGANSDIAGRVQVILRAAQPVLPLTDALIGETKETVATLDQIRKEPDSEFERTVKSMSPGASGLEPLTVDQIKLAREIYDGAEAQYLRDMATILNSVRKPTAANAAETIILNSKFTTELDLTDPFVGLANTFDPPISGILNVQTRTLAQETVILAAAEILKVRANTGAFPAALPSGFTDPYTEKLLNYTTNGTDSFTVSSAGPQTGESPESLNRQMLAFSYPLVPVPLPPDRL